MPKALEHILLERSDWLSETPHSFRSELLSGARLHVARVRTMVSAGGDHEGELIGLIEGVVAVSAANGPADGPLMHCLRPVSWFGFGPILAPEPRRFTVFAQTDVRLATIPTSRLSWMLRSHPAYYRFVVPLLIRTADHLTSSGIDLLIRDGQRRCVAVLLRLAGGTAEVPISQEALALAANLSPNSVSAILGARSRAGLIGTAYRRIILIRRDELARIAWPRGTHQSGSVGLPP